MMDVKQQIQQKISDALKKEFDIELSPDKVHLEHPQDATYGDWATNVAMTLAKDVKQSPSEIAVKLVESLRAIKDGLVDEIEVAGPGFVNFKVSASYYKNLLRSINEDFGKHEIGSGRRVMVEFGQPNTHKAFHVGHLKSAISGLSIVRLYQNLGYEVIQANFYGDVGMHVAKCTWGALKKGLPEGIEGMDIHERMKLIDQFYVFGSQQFGADKQVEEEVREVNRQIYAREQNEAYQMYEKLRDWSLEHLNAAFNKLGVHYDRQYPESEMTDEAISIVKANIGRVFAESDGAIIFDGTKEGVNTMVFLTKEGLPTYEGKDLALAYKKFQEYDLDLSIITTSVEQADRFKTVIRALEKIDQKFTGKYVHLPFGWLLREHKKSSSRMGESVKGMDVLDEAVGAAEQKISDEKNYTHEEASEISRGVGVGGLRFLILSHEFHKDINYNPDQFTSFEGFSGPYIMYSYVRAKSILREAGSFNDQADIGDNVLNDPEELDLAKQLAQYPEITLAAGEQNSPHLVCYYLYDVAQLFARFYKDHYVLSADVPQNVREARLALVQASATVLKSGLNLLGIETVEKM